MNTHDDYSYTNEVIVLPQKRTHKRKRKNLGAISIILCSTFIGSGAGFFATSYYLSNNYTAPEPVYIYETIQIEPEKTDNAVLTAISSNNSNSLSASDLYSQNIDACVGITVSNVRTNAFGQNSTTASSGSGFVVTNDGYVVTNHHVIADAISNSSLTLEVSFYDGTSYPATLVGYEEDNDLAVLKINATNLHYVNLGNSDKLQVGEAVYAIGNPLGELTFSLTDGLVSALDRLISTDDGTTMNMLQTNTAINPGNSGGPLFNDLGEVIGITTAKYSTSSSGTTVEGLGFAVPINDVENIIYDLITYGYVTGKPYMGIQAVNAQFYGASTGAYVSYVAEGSCSERAGLLVGDIIIGIDDVAINSSSAITAVLNSYSAGDSATITVSRNGSTQSLYITFDEKNSTTELANQTEQSQTSNRLP